MSARRRATNGRAVDNRDTVIEHTNTQEDDRSGGNRDIDIENTFYAAPPDRHAHGSRRRARRVCACAVGGEVCGRGSDEPPQRWFVARTYIPAPHYGCVGKYTSHGQRAQLIPRRDSRSDKEVCGVKSHSPLGFSNGPKSQCPFRYQTQISPIFPLSVG